MRKLLALAVMVAFGSIAFGYTNPFTLTFEDPGDTAGWSDLSGDGSTFTAGENATAGSSFPTAPQSATNYPGSDWLRMNTPQPQGVGMGIYDGTAGGSTADVSVFTVEADIYIATNVTHRYHVGLVGSWETGDARGPIEFFYSWNTPIANTDGFGVRGSSDAVTTTYQIPGFPTINNQALWIRMRMVINGNVAAASVDMNRDGTYDHTISGISFDGNPGKPGFFMVINDPSSGAPITGTYLVIDNFKYTPSAGVSDWSLY